MPALGTLIDVVRLQRGRRSDSLNNSSSSTSPNAGNMNAISLERKSKGRHNSRKASNASLSTTTVAVTISDGPSQAPFNGRTSRKKHCTEDDYGKTNGQVISDLDSTSLLLASRSSGSMPNSEMDLYAHSKHRGVGSIDGWVQQLSPDQRYDRVQHPGWGTLQHVVDRKEPHMVGGTLGRHPMPPPTRFQHQNLASFRRQEANPELPPPPPLEPEYESASGYPMYHTCERREKKRVTIVEDNNTESSV